MSRYIDADAVYETLCHLWDRSDSEEFEKEVFNTILSAPSIDIVRCKECKHAHMTYDGLCKYCDTWKDDDGNCLELYLDGDYYCADGEREGE